MERIKHTLLFVTSLLLMACNSQQKKVQNSYLTISPLIDIEKQSNKLIISALTNFLLSKNESLSENKFWKSSDFEKYVYPYSDLYNVEQSKYGNDFYKPTVMEILPTENEDTKIVKIAFIGHNSETNENLLKSIYNIVANVENENVTFSKYLDFATKDWTKQQVESITYIISANKNANEEEIIIQKSDVIKLCNFFNTKPIAITYYSCKNPKELFEIKGFDYNPMMYVDESGGMADLGNIIFSGNNSEIYTHEIVHIYTNSLYPKINKYLDEGIATYIAGSGKYNYEWHRNKLADFLIQNPQFNFTKHIDPYERLYFENETSIPYITAALICERTKRIYGNKKLIEVLQSEEELWLILKKVGITKENMNSELFKEIKLATLPIW